MDTRVAGAVRKQGMGGVTSAHSEFLYIIQNWRPTHPIFGVWTD